MDPSSPSLPSLPSLSALLDMADELFAESKIAILVTVLALLAALVATCVVSRGSSSKEDKIAIIGICGAGKTSLFYKLRDGTTHGGTVTSMEPNDGRFPLFSDLAKNPKSRSIHIVDLPGHPRLRNKIDDILPQTKKIIFLIDALDIMQQLRPIAELLWQVLTKGSVVKRRVPILLVCNKMDKISAHSISFAKKMLEKEIDKLRVTRSVVTEADISSEVVIGTTKEPFKFTQCVNPIFSCEVSVLEGKISEVESFILDSVKS